MKFKIRASPTVDIYGGIKIRLRDMPYDRRLRSITRAHGLFEE